MGHFLVRLFVLSAFILPMKIELNWILFTLFFEVLRRPFWLFCKVNEIKTTCDLTCFLIEFMFCVEKLESLSNNDKILKCMKIQAIHLLMSC